MGPLVVQDHLVEVVVLPFSGNLQVPRGHADLLEPGLLQHPLRANVVQKGARLDAVKSELVACHFDYPLDRRGRQPAACITAVHPVAQPRVLERPPHDACHVESADECVPVKQA